MFDELTAGGGEKLLPVHRTEPCKGGDLAGLEDVCEHLGVAQANADLVRIGAGGFECFAGEDDVLAVIEDLDRPHDDGERPIVDGRVHFLGEGGGDLCNVATVALRKRGPQGLGVVVLESLGNGEHSAVWGVRNHYLIADRIRVASAANECNEDH